MRVDLDTGLATNVEVFLDPATHLQPASTTASIFHPALSPANDRIAFEYRSGNSIGEMKVCSLADKKCATVSTGAPNDQGRWGNWLSTNEILFALSGGTGSAWSDVYRVPLAADGLSPASTPTILLGAAGTPAGVNTSAFAFEDGFAFTKNGTRYVASHGNWPAAPSCHDSNGKATTNRADCVYFPSSVPSVWDIDRGVGYPVKLDMQTIETPWACAHVAMSPDGERLVCTPQETYGDQGKVPSPYVYGYPYSVDVDTDHNGTADHSVKQYVALEFGLDSTQKSYVSTTGREMFTHLRPGALEKLDSRFSQAACGSPTHSIWMHKFTEYCGDSNHIITGVSCAGPTVLGDAYEDLPNKIVYSAVYLIDISDRANPKYTNLTNSIEKRLGELGTPASLMSQFATCGHL